MVPPQTCAHTSTRVTTFCPVFYLPSCRFRCSSNVEHSTLPLPLHCAPDLLPTNSVPRVPSGDGRPLNIVSEVSPWYCGATHSCSRYLSRSRFRGSVLTRLFSVASTSRSYLPPPLVLVKKHTNATPDSFTSVLRSVCHPGVNQDTILIRVLRHHRVSFP